MSKLENIPGIRRVNDLRADPLIPSKELTNSISVKPLTNDDIPEVIRVLNRGIDATPDRFLSPDRKVFHKKLKKASYYENILAEPQDQTLIARNTVGTLLAFLETTTFEIDGMKVGYINWILTDPDSRGTGAALELYRNYENIAHDTGINILMANIAHNNTPSHKLHHAARFRSTPYLPGETSNRYYKVLNPPSHPIPITEATYLPEDAVGALGIVQKIMAEKELGTLHIIDAGEDQGAERLFNIAADGPTSRRDAQTLFAAAVNAFDTTDEAPPFALRVRAAVEQKAEELIGIKKA
jgi:GNAT superfamily N-acetyltransferase